MLLYTPGIEKKLGLEVEFEVTWGDIWESYRDLLRATKKGYYGYFRSNMCPVAKALTRKLGGEVHVSERHGNNWSRSDNSIYNKFSHNAWPVVRAFDNSDGPLGFLAIKPGKFKLQWL